MTVLLQDKLNVTQKSRSNIFNWRGQFTPEFVEYILKSYTKEGDLVIDPFSGSGTVLQEAANLKLAAIGFEINPAAYAMSKFFSFCNFSLSERWELISSFERKLNLSLKPLNGEIVFLDKSDYRQAYSNLIHFGNNISRDLNQDERILLLNILFLSERDKKLTVKQSIVKSYYYIKNILLGLSFVDYPIKAILADARDVGIEINESADLILTSPPYINVFNYHQNYRALVEIFNFDILKVANSEFGSNRKNRGNRFKTVVQYSIDMEQAIRGFWYALKPNAHLILVVGRESNVRNTAFYNSQIIMDIVTEMNGFEKIETLERQFINKFGNSIKEDILIYKKNCSLKNGEFAREVAKNHLEKTLLLADGEIKYDLEEAIKSVFQIEPSPLFNSNQVINND